MEEIERIEYTLLKELLGASNNPYEVVLESLLEAITLAIPTQMCSLWLLNENAECLSINVRVNYNPPTQLKHEFVHPTKGSLTGFLVEKYNQTDNDFIEINNVRDTPYWEHHLSKERILKLNLKRLISIPIHRYEDRHEESKRIDAVLNFYIQDESFVFHNRYAKILKEHLSITLTRKRLFEREKLVQNIINIYEKRGEKDLASIFHPIITRVFNTYIKYDACSIYVWDAFKNRFNLEQTTGIENKPHKSEVFFYLGEGIIGKIAELKEQVILNNLNKITDDRFNNIEMKIKEATQHKKNSFMGLPIKSPSRPEEILGIICFVNRLNPLANIPDFFSEDDLDFIKYGCNLIALYIEKELTIKRNHAFARQMIHEVLSPVSQIRGTARRLLLYRDTDKLPKRKTDDYIKSIIEQTENQDLLSKRMQYAYKESKVAKKTLYEIERCNIYEIIRKSIKRVTSELRELNLRIDDVITSGNFPDLYLEINAFQEVFYNLLTNSIKYRNIKEPKSFSIKINGLPLGHYDVPQESLNQHNNDIQNKPMYNKQLGYIIQFEDQGIGVESSEKDNVFLYGYRKPGIEETDVKGSGVGLTIIKNILNDFYSTIWLDNLRNPTRFSIFLSDKLSNEKYIHSADWSIA